MMRQYDRLTDRLTAIGAATIILTFAEVEALVGSLPAEARHSPYWWGATAAARYQHPHAFRWWQAGYVADRPDFVAGTVTFRRVVG
jgi:hypothetical protein